MRSMASKSPNSTTTIINEQQMAKAEAIAFHGFRSKLRMIMRTQEKTDSAPAGRSAWDEIVLVLPAASLPPARFCVRTRKTIPRYQSSFCKLDNFLHTHAEEAVLRFKGSPGHVLKSNHFGSLG